MTKAQISWILGFLLTLGTMPAWAGELWVLVFRGDKPAENVRVELDGNRVKTTNASGRVEFESLDGGLHRVAIGAEGDELSGFRFSSASGQNADAVVRLSEAGEEIDVSAEAYSPRESVSDRERGTVGSLVGSVTRDDTGAAVSGAQVNVAGYGLSVQTDPSGRFELELPRGVYELNLSHPSYPDETYSEVRVVASVTQQRNLSLSGAEASGAAAARADIQRVSEEMLVVGSYTPETATMLKRDSQAVIESIDSEQLGRFGDGEVVGALSRSVGITIQEDKFVFVRGLGGRYVTTSLNGASLASTDPTRRSVPLDLFPSNMMENISIQKSYSPDLPGDATGAHVELETKSYPADPIRKFSFGVEANTRVTGSSVPTDPTSGDLDFLGYDDGERDKPLLGSALQAFGESRLTPSASLLERTGESFDNKRTPDDDDAPPDVKLGASLGDSFEMGDSEFGYLAVLDYENEWSTQDNGFTETFRGGSDGTLVSNTSSEFEKATNTIDINGMLSLGLELGLNHQFRLLSMINRSTFSSVRRDQGFNEGADLIDFEGDQIEWTERALATYNLSGEHVFPNAGGLEADWTYSFSYGDRYSPDRRVTLFEQRNEGDPLQLQLGVGTTERRFEQLEDKNHEVNVNILLPFELFNRFDGSLKVGGGTIRKTREFDVDRFGFRLLGTDRTILEETNADGVLSADDILSEENIGERFVIEDRSEARDDFEADWAITWGYLEAMFESQRFQVNGGLRIENSEQVLDTFRETTGRPQKISLDQSENLPSAAFTWFLNEDMQIRLAASETVARPDFKELSNATFIDPIFNFVVQGNSNLKISQITNLDLRWEWFFNSNDNLTLGVFYKDIDDPIEQVFQNISSSAEPNRIFTNQESAELTGVEFNFRKEVALDASYTQSLFLGLNATVIDSEVKLGGAAAQSEGVDERDLQNQAKNTLNVQFGYDHLGAGHQVTLLYNRVGDRISDGGGAQLPPVVEEPFNSLNLVYEYSGLRNIVLKSEVNNLLDDTREFTQGGQTFRKFEPGVGVEFELTWEF